MLQRRNPIGSLLVLFCTFFSLSTVHAQEMPDGVHLIESDVIAAKRASEVFIVQLRENPIAGYTGGVAGIAATKPVAGQKLNLAASNVQRYFDHLAQSHSAVMSDVGVDEAVHNYSYSFNGFAAQLTPEQLSALEEHPEVVQIWRDELLQPQTDNSYRYLRLNNEGGPWDSGITGEDVVIGVIDSGIWPEHPSFADVETPENGDRGPRVPYDAPPASWNGTACQFGNSGFNPLDAPFDCNNKLVGAQYFANGFLAFSDLIPSEYLSARDNDGHGSHVASTAGGNAKVEASIEGEKLGKVSGMAPRARIAAYKVCWNGSFPPAGFLNGCFSSDSMAAIDQAVADGVDVINFSVGGSSTSFAGPDDIAFLFAADAGVFVATSQGNTGPGEGTTGTPAGVPWLTSVGAGQDNQVFNLGIDVSSADAGVSGTREAVEAAISTPIADTGDVVADLVPVDDGVSIEGCGPVVNDLTGAVALIQRGSCAFSQKILNAQNAGAVGVVVFNNDGDPITMGGSSAGITIPAVMIGESDGDEIAASIAGGDSAVVTLSEAIQIAKKNTIATFSSRGPNGGSPDIIKPDVTAPGVDILAAQTPTPNDGQLEGQLFQSIGGTSMSSPHVAGLGALLLQENPDWTPETVRSALMTSARQNMRKTFGGEFADAFDVGAGLANIRGARNPGLVYQTNLIEYIQYLCGEPLQPGIVPPAFCAAFGAIDPSDLNLPSVGVAELVGAQTVTRRVTRVDTQGTGPTSTFKAWVEAPDGIDVQVSPSTLELADGETAQYELTFTTTGDAQVDEWAFGQVQWEEVGTKGGDFAHVKASSPIAVKPVAASFPGTVALADAATDGSVTMPVQAGFPGIIETNAGGLNAPEIQTLPQGIEVGGATAHFFFVPPGTRLARFSLFDESVGDGTGADDLDLQIQGPDSAGYPLVDTSGSATSTEQVDMVDPVPGFYLAFVIRFATVNPVTPYDLHGWSVGPNLGNVTSSDPGAVSAGDSVGVDVDWTGLAPDTKYRGIVEISNQNGEIGFTILEIDTAP